MEKLIIHTAEAPEAIGPYSQAVKQKELVFISGQLPIDPSTNDIISGDVKAQTRQSLKNIERILKAAGSSLEKVIKTTIFIQDMNDFTDINSVYAEFFKQNYPTRSCVEVARLPKDSLVEIEVIASA